MPDLWIVPAWIAWPVLTLFGISLGLLIYEIATAPLIEDEEW